MRHIGSILIAVSALIVGVFRASEYKNEARLISSLINALEILKSEIVTRRTPMLDVVYIIMKDRRLSGFCAELLKYADEAYEKSFGDIWTEAVTEKLSALPQSCLDAVMSLAPVLGRYGTELQSEAIERCTAVLQAEADAHSAQLRDRVRLYIGAYGGIGLIVAILFF